MILCCFPSIIQVLKLPLDCDSISTFEFGILFYSLYLFTPFGVLDLMSLALSNVVARVKPAAKTMFTVGMYMGCGDLLMQKIALKRDKLYYICFCFSYIVKLVELLLSSLLVLLSLVLVITVLTQLLLVSSLHTVVMMYLDVSCLLTFSSLSLNQLPSFQSCSGEMVIFVLGKLRL